MELRPLPDDTHDGSVEIIADGNDADENGNWRIIIVGTKLKVQKKVGGTWKSAGIFSVR